MDGYVGGSGVGGDGHGERHAGIEEGHAEIKEGQKGIGEEPEENTRFIRSCMISLAFMLYTDERI